MSVMVMIRVPGKASNLEAMAADSHRDLLVSISEEGKRMGAIHHCFLEDTDGSLLVLDEWESEEQFQSFFTGQDDIPKVMADAGVTGAPVPTAYRILDTPDRF